MPQKTRQRCLYSTVQAIEKLHTGDIKRKKNTQMEKTQRSQLQYSVGARKSWVLVRDENKLT